MKATYAVLVCVMLCITSPLFLAAQGVRVHGMVVKSSDTTAGVAGVSVTAGGKAETVRTDLNGRYTIHLPTREVTLIQARAMGYATRAVLVQPDSQNTAVPLLVLTPLPGQLGTVTINGGRREYPVRFADAYQRAAAGRGAFFIREQIDSLQPVDVRSLIAMVPGVRVSDRQIDFARCNTGLSSARSATGTSREGGSGGWMEGVIQVYIDGVRVTRSFVESPLQAVRRIPIQQVQIVEVYTSQSVLPPEFMSDACAVIAIWTRSY